MAAMNMPAGKASTVPSISLPPTLGRQQPDSQLTGHSGHHAIRPATERPRPMMNPEMASFMVSPWFSVRRASRVCRGTLAQHRALRYGVCDRAWTTQKGGGTLPSELREARLHLSAERSAYSIIPRLLSRRESNPRPPPVSVVPARGDRSSAGVYVYP